MNIKFGPAASEWQSPFGDVATGDWFYGDVAYVYTKGLMLGTGTDPMLFSPQAKLTRGMVVTVLYRSAGSLDVNGIADPFNDIPSGQYYTDAVKWAATNNIVSGYGNGAFGPNDNITREQLAVILYNYAVFEDKGPVGMWAVRLGFTDAGDISDWATEGVMFCSMKGIINGYPDGSFVPQGGATRAEGAAMLHRFMETVDAIK